MKVKVLNPVEVEISTLVIEANVRYPEDAELTTGERFVSDDHENPFMPCMIKANNKFLWCPTIDIEKGKILNWKRGVKAKLNYKVCDEFKCQVLDADCNIVTEYDDYVPDFMAIDDEGYGDYIILEINDIGYIKNWKFRKQDFEYLYKN